MVIIVRPRIRSGAGSEAVEGSLSKNPPPVPFVPGSGPGQALSPSKDAVEEPPPVRPEPVEGRPSKEACRRTPVSVRPRIRSGAGPDPVEGSPSKDDSRFPTALQRRLRTALQTRDPHLGEFAAGLPSVSESVLIYSGLRPDRLQPLLH